MHTHTYTHIKMHYYLLFVLNSFVQKTFIIQWKEGERLSALYNNFIQLFKMALKHCKLVYTIKYPHHTSAVYALQFQNLFENLILLEYKCGNLEAAKISIRKVLSVHPSYLGMWLLLADVVVKCGYTEGYKEVLDITILINEVYNLQKIVSSV